MQPPVVRVGVACFVWKDGKFLLIQRRTSHGDGTWSLPGGHLEFGESWEEGAAREAYEETGVTIKNPRFLTATNDRFSEKKHYITIWMEADWDSGEPRIMEPTITPRVVWSSIADLPTENLFEPCWTNLRAARPDLFA